jgi:diguanylate cyclase (GGDEF)-like protein/PAS domain S-box-containing protein
VNLKRPREDTLDVAYASGEEIPERRKGDSFPLKGSVSEVAMRTRTGLIVRSADILKKTGRFSTLGVNLQAGLHSMMSAPLISRDEAIGALVFRAEKQDAYTEQDLRLAERIGAQIAGAIANAQLFTDLKRAGTSLRESEGRFRALFEQAAVGVAEVEMVTGRFLTVNRRLCEMVGRTEEEMLATTFQAITHPEDLHTHEDKAALLLAGKIGHYALEKRYLRKDGAIIWVDITVSPLWKPGEAPERNIAVVQDITDRKRLEEEMREMSFRDQLTELYNRRGFTTLTEQQLKAANRAKRPMRLTFIDCDGLKWINDTLGHEEGDKVLVDTANVLRQTFRESDIIARLGGDEFAVLSIDATDMNSETFSKRLQQSIDEYNEKESRPYKLAMSWGTAIYDPESPMSLDKLMSSADELMYAQKKSKSSRRV